MRKFNCFVFLVLFSLLLGCTSNTSKENTEDNDVLSNNDTTEVKEELVLYTSIYPMQYVVEQIANDNATVKSIYPPGVDAHTYEPTSKEITDLANGDAFFYIGAGMEGFSDSARDALASQKILFIAVEDENESLFIEGNHEHDDHEDEDHHDHGDLDPHIWLDPLRMIEIGEIVKDTLIELNPNKEEVFTKNFASLKEKMLKLNEDFKDTLQSKEDKKIIVTHAAYGYWEEMYGIEQIPINGLSSTDEPSQKDLVNIAEIAKEYNLQYVIFEQNSTNRLATIIQEHIGAEKLELHNLEVLVDEDIKNNDDYLSLMYNNLNILDQAIK